MELILYLIIGGVIGWLAGAILDRNLPGGIIGNITVGTFGAWIGGELGFFDFGPIVRGIQIIPALIGATIIIIALSLILKIRR